MKVLNIVNFENRNTILECVNYLNMKPWIFNLFGVDKQMCLFECWLFFGKELLAIL